MPESHPLQTSARVFAGYKTYAGGPEVVGARAPADIGAAEGAPATVSVVGRVEEVFSAVKVTRVGSKWSRERGGLTGSAYIWKLAID